MTFPVVLADFGRTRVFPPRAELVRASPGWSRTGANFWERAEANVARFESNVLRGIWLEVARENLITDPRTPYSTGWTNNNLADIASVVGPDKIAGTAFEASDGVSNAAHYTVSPTFPVGAGSRYTFSALLYLDGVNLVQLGFDSAFRANVWQNFNIEDNELELAGANVVAASVVNQGRGWRRCQITGESSITGTTQVYIQHIISPTAGYQQAHLGASRVLRVAWPQVELGNYASTPILPEVSGTATREADEWILDLRKYGVDADFGGTLSIRARAADGYDGVEQELIRVDDETTDNMLRIVRQSDGQLRVNLTVGGAATATMFAPETISDSERFELAFAFSNTRIAATISGSAVESTTYSVPELNMHRLRISGWGGLISRVAFYAGSLGDSELRRLTMG